jgi:hypothetical protein
VSRAQRIVSAARENDLGNFLEFESASYVLSMRFLIAPDRAMRRDQKISCRVRAP